MFSLTALNSLLFQTKSHYFHQIGVVFQQNKLKNVLMVV